MSIKSTILAISKKVIKSHENLIILYYLTTAKCTMKSAHKIAKWTVVTKN